MTEIYKEKILIFLGAFWVVALVSLYWVFTGQVRLPQGFEFMGWYFHYYGLIMASAIMCSWLFILETAKEFKVKKETLDSAGFWVIISGFVGARFYHVLTDFNLYRDNWLGVFWVWKGGLSIYGALIGGFFGILLVRRFFAEIKKISIWQILDLAVLAVLIGQIIGRFGNLFNYEAFGKPTEFFWGMYVPVEFRPWGYEAFNYFHPTFLYEALGNTLIFVVLWRFKNRLKVGSLFLAYIILYNALRLITEVIRLDAKIINGIYFNWWLSFALMLTGFISLFIFKKYGKRA